MVYIIREGRKKVKEKEGRCVWGKAGIAKGRAEEAGKRAGTATASHRHALPSLPGCLPSPDTVHHHHLACSLPRRKSASHHRPCWRHGEREVAGTHCHHIDASPSSTCLPGAVPGGGRQACLPPKSAKRREERDGEGPSPRWWGGGERGLPSAHFSIPRWGNTHTMAGKEIWYSLCGSGRHGGRQAGRYLQRRWEGSGMPHQALSSTRTHRCGGFPQEGLGWVGRRPLQNAFPRASPPSSTATACHLPVLLSWQHEAPLQANVGKGTLQVNREREGGKERKRSLSLGVQGRQ